MKTLPEQFQKYRIQTRLIFYYIVFAITTVALVAYFAYAQAEQSLRSSVQDKLETVARLQVDFLNQWAADQQSNALLLASLPELRLLSGKVLDPDSALVERLEAREALTRLVTLIAQRSADFQDVQILDPEGVIVISASPANVGKSQSGQTFFQEGQTRTFTQGIYLSELFDKPILSVATPLFDEANKRVGVLALHLNMRRVDSITQQDQHLNEPIQSYLFTRERAIITEDPILLNQASMFESLAIESALEGSEGVASYTNHNGIPVIGEYLWIENQNAALIVEIDEETALWPARRLAINIVTAGLILSLILVLIVIVFAERITTPLRTLTETAARISAGDLEAVAPVLSQDEVGSLARALNSMTEKLRQTLAGLQQELHERQHVEQAVRENEEKFRKVFHSSPVATCITTLEEGRLLEANYAYWDLTGYDSQSSIGKNAEELKMWDVPEERKEFVQNLKAKRSLFNPDDYFYHTDGSIRFVISFYELIQIRQEDCILAMFYDMSAQKRTVQVLQQSEARTRALLEAIPDLIFEISSDGTFLKSIQPSVHALYLEPDQFIGRKIGDVMPEAIAEQTMTAVQRVLGAGKLESFEYQLQREDGIHDYEARIAASGTESVLAIVRDITQRKWAETERERFIAELEARNRETETLRNSLASIVTTFDLEEVVERILDQIKLVIPYDTASVWRVDQEWQTLLVSRDLPPQISLADLRIRIDEDNSSRPLIYGEKRFVLSNDVQAELKDFMGPHSYINSWLAVPLKKRDKIIGLIALDGVRKGQFTEHHAKLAATFADQVAIAFENADLFSELQSELALRENLIKELEQKNAEAKTLHESLASMVGTLEVQQIVHRVLFQIRQVIPYDTASVWKVEGRQQYMIAGVDLPSEIQVPGTVLEVDENNSALPILQGKAPYILNNNVQAELNDFQAPHNFVQSWLAIPLKTRGRIIGLIALDGRSKNQFSEHDADLAVTFANQVAIALENARLFEELQAELKKQIALHSASMAISSFLHLDEVLYEICKQICVANNGTSAYIAQYEQDSSALVTVAEYIGANANPKERVSDLGVPYYKRDGAWLFQEENQLEFIVMHADDENMSPWARHIMSIYGGWSILYVPLYVQGRMLGHTELWDSRGRREFTPDEISFCRTLSQQAAIAIANAHLFEQLQKELKERKELIAELENKNAELERFTYTVSHDLKSPLFTIRGFLGYLEQDALAGNMARVQADMKRITDATEKMQNLLNDLLELSRIGRLKNASVIIPFEELAREAVELVHGRLMESDVVIEIAANLPAVSGDRPRLLEVLQNLIDNAAKFMGTQKAPRIEIGQHGEAAPGLPIFYVRDNGMGISPEHFERIFGLFNKLDAKSEGTGIGLALVKRIVEVHGGRIWVESAVGQGATFYFTLPTAGQ
jgi:PAS domain S-box-containing protein